MTQHEQMLAQVIFNHIQGLDPQQAIQRLVDGGLLNRRACEQIAVRERINELARKGVPRCEAMYSTADLFCCSYEKIRGLYYNTLKS